MVVLLVEGDVSILAWYKLLLPLVVFPPRVEYSPPWLLTRVYTVYYTPPHSGSLIMSSYYCHHGLNTLKVYCAPIREKIFQRVQVRLHSKWVPISSYWHLLCVPIKNSRYNWNLRNWSCLEHNPHWSVARLGLNEESFRVEHAPSDTPSLPPSLLPHPPLPFLTTPTNPQVTNPKLLHP